MNNILTRPICDSEVEDAVFQMGSLRAPRPDGFQGIFYQCYWDVISQEVRGIACDFMNGEISPKKLNSTQIVLIPKVSNSETVTQFRRISLSGRQMQDNILIAHEIFHFMKLRRTKRKFELGIKLDMNKAYDQANQQNCRNIVQILKAYCTASGQQVIHKINCGHAAFMEANKRSNRAAVGSGTSPVLFVLCVGFSSVFWLYPGVIPV
ncbi:uncharacterized protein [Malus domestica]|uniref:uncharacterized protein n=1 Tax=Malus domestica TaxID=3750 RepID=UPI0039749220